MVVFAPFGLTSGIIDLTQYTIVVAVVIVSAIVPMLIAQTWFRPAVTLPDDDEIDAALEPVPLQHRHDGTRGLRQGLIPVRAESEAIHVR